MPITPSPGGRTGRPGRSRPRFSPPSIAALFAALVVTAPPVSAGAEGTEWALAEGRITVRAHRWAARCGALPAEGSRPPGDRYLRRGASTLLPIDDAAPVFGPGVCRAIMIAADPWEEAEGPDITCGAGAGSTGRLALRALGTERLSVVHQLRLAPEADCAADVTAAFVLRRAGAEADTEAPAPGPAAPGSAAALAPTAPPAMPPDPVPVPAQRLIAVTASAPPPDPEALPPRRLPLYALAASLVLVGLVGLLRSLRRR